MRGKQYVCIGYIIIPSRFEEGSRLLSAGCVTSDIVALLPFGTKVKWRKVKNDCACSAVVWTSAEVSKVRAAVEAWTLFACDVIGPERAEEVYYRLRPHKWQLNSVTPSGNKFATVIFGSFKPSEYISSTGAKQSRKFWFFTVFEEILHFELT